MELNVAPGKYVVAVSGGVDSVVLLNVLSKMSDLDLVVAHFDHGIRPDSAADCAFVKELARGYGFAFESRREELGEHAGEALAREKRYEFLYSIRVKYDADVIITAHHSDDDLETACLNILRGTFRKGVSSLHSKEILRPFLSYSKTQLLTYAKNHHLVWREDVTNTDERYLRNWLRVRLERADKELKSRLKAFIEESSVRNTEIDMLSAEVFAFGRADSEDTISRSFFIALPYNVSCEILAHWLRLYGIEFGKKNIELLVAHLKTARNGTRFDAGDNHFFFIEGERIRLAEG